jgi:hypothetical protein
MKGIPGQTSHCGNCRCLLKFRHRAVKIALHTSASYPFNSEAAFKGAVTAFLFSLRLM